MPEGHFELYFFLEVKQVYLTAQRPQQWAQRPSKQPTAHATKKLSVLVWARLLLLGLRNSFKRKKTEFGQYLPSGSMVSLRGFVETHSLRSESGGIGGV